MGAYHLPIDRKVTSGDKYKDTQTGYRTDK